MDYKSINFGVLANSRFRRIACDLKKLPCELHDGILVDLEFEQLIRLSSCPGPRLTWSLQNSLAPFARFFRGGNFEQWQKLLSLSDKVRFLCCRQPTKKGERTGPFDQDGDLSFLKYQVADWNMPARSVYSRAQQAYLPGRRFAKTNPADLAAHWLDTLHKKVFYTLKMGAYDKCNSRELVETVKTWINDLQGAADSFAEIPILSTRGLRIEPCKLTCDELAQFIELYQSFRLVRASALSRELLQLANLYEAHPTRLKTLYADEPRPNKRPFNPLHVPSKLRGEAHNMVRRAQTTGWNRKKNSQYEHRFMAAAPALVPYEWAMQLFNKVLREPVFRDTVKVLQDDAQSATEDLGMNHSKFPNAKTSRLTQHPPAAFMEQCKSLLEAPPPSWLVDKAAEADSVADLINTFAQQHLDPNILKPWIGNRISCHLLAPAEIEWLKTCVEVAAWMQEHFPVVALRAQKEYPGIFQW
jgi:hypothetical protein